MENLERVRAIFHEAFELFGTARDEFLSRVTEGDRELRRRVERLLAAAEKEDEFLAGPTAGPEARAAAASEEVGTVIGRYKPRGS